MAGLSDLVQKALYLGVGLAAYAAEKAGANLQELKAQAEKLADEMVERGEMTAEEARRYVDDLVRQAQQQVTVETSSEDSQNKEPRRIEIISDEEPDKTAAPEDVDALRKEVEALQAELRRLKQK